MFDAPPWWWQPWEYFALLRLTIISSYQKCFYFKWWTRLRHHLFESLLHFCIIFTQISSLVQSPPIFTGFGFNNNLYYIYSTNLWHDAHVLGYDCSWIFAATIDNDKSRSVDCRKATCSTVLVLPSSFNVPSSQQIWLCLPCSAESKNGIGSLKLLNKWNGQLSMLTLILDSGENLFLFNNKSLFERLTTLSFNKKRVHGVHKFKHCYQK